jgi:hypothetical protein
VLQPSEEVAYFWGIFSGDGSLSQFPRTQCLCIACDSSHVDLILTYSNLLQKLLEKRVGTYQRRNCTYLRVYGKVLSEKTGFPCGTKSKNGFALPEWIWTDKTYLRAFVRGLIETDGGFYQVQHHGGEFWFC